MFFFRLLLPLYRESRDRTKTFRIVRKGQGKAHPGPRPIHVLSLRHDHSTNPNQPIHAWHRPNWISSSVRARSIADCFGSEWESLLDFAPLEARTCPALLDTLLPYPFSNHTRPILLRRGVGILYTLAQHRGRPTERSAGVYTRVKNHPIPNDRD